MFSKSSNSKSSGLSAGDNSVVIGGNVQGSNIIVGNHNVINNQYAPVFAVIYHYIEEHPKLTPMQKEDAKAEIREIETIVQKGDEPDETFLARRFRNLQRMAPDIIDVALTTIGNPVAGVGKVIQKVVQKVADEAKPEK